MDEVSKDVFEEVKQAKNFEERKFNYFTDNFYVMKSALRYYSIKKGISFTSSKLSEDFPVAVTVAGSCLNILGELGIVEPRTDSSSPNRYTPEKIKVKKMEEIGKVLRQNHEIKPFYGEQE